MNYVWDNANIVESYPGICSPLTFSFARYVYRGVYLQTAPLFGVEPRTTEALYRKLETFLGYCDGRFYYNLETWCTLISYLPGFGANPKLLQEMMGVRPADRLTITPVPVSHARKAWLLARALYYHFALPGLTDRWLAQFNANFQESRRKLSTILDVHDAMQFFFDLEQLYLRNWQVPILNDFAVMIYSGILRQLSRRWMKSELAPVPIGNIGESGVVRMVVELKRIANMVQADPALLRDCQTLAPAAVWARLQGQPAQWALIERFLDEFGLRNGNDLKLETPNIREEPAQFVEMLQQYLAAQAQEPGGTPSATISSPSLPRLQKTVFERFTRLTRRAIARREEMRVKRSQVFGMAREIFLNIGTAFVTLDLLDVRDDIFFLEMEEVFGTLRGTTTLRDLRVLVAQRRSELASSATRETKAHFTSVGIPFRGEARWEGAAAPGMPSELRGNPNYPAVVTGEVMVMDRPDFSKVVRDKIVVCRQTDPSWVPLFGLIKGLIVERGGILSHAAIVCRELKVPSVIGVTDATRLLKSGQQVTLDSAQGTVTIL